MENLYLAWLNGQYQILRPLPQQQTQIADNVANPGVKPQQRAISCQGGPSNRQTDVSYQTAGEPGPYVNLQNPCLNVQGGHPFHGSRYQNATNHSLAQHGSGFRLNTPPLTTAAPLQVRQGVSKTGKESSTASNTHIASVNKTQYGPLSPSANQQYLVSSNPNTFVLKPQSTGQSLQGYILIQPTMHIPSTVLVSSQTNIPKAAESRRDVIGTTMQGTTNQQTTTQSRNQLVTTHSTTHLLNLNPLLSDLLLAPGSVSKSSQSLPTNKVNDNSISTRVIAVVQPLSPQCDIITPASKNPSPHNLNLPIVDAQNKTTKEDCRNPPESETQPQSNKCLRMHASAIRHADDTPSQVLRLHPLATKLADDMLRKDHCLGSCASKLATLETPAKERGTNDHDKMPPDAKASILELSSFPTTTWTLKDLVLMGKRLAMQGAPANDNLPKQLLDMFWGGSCDNLACSLKTKYWSALIRHVYLFCANSVKEDTVVLSQVCPSFADQLKNFHVLKDGEVYTELPYTSSWLNTNEQLDDIDKEFGPNIYRYVPHNQPDPVKKVASVSSQDVSKVPRSVPERDDQDCNEPLANITPQNVAEIPRSDPDTGGKDCNDPLANISPQNVAEVPRSDPDTGGKDCIDPLANITPQNVAEIPRSDPDTGGKDCIDPLANITPQNVAEIPRSDPETGGKVCNDPLYSFKIQVLSPEKAKAIFELGRVVMSPSIGQPKEVLNTSGGVEDEPLPEVYVTSGSKLKNPLNRFCCIAKWKEIILGSKTSSDDKCHCKEGFTKTREQMNCPQFTIEPDRQSHSLEGDMESKSKGRMSSSLPTISWLKICNEISETFELNDDQETNDLHGQQPKGSQAKMTRENKDDVANCDIPTNHIADNEEDLNKAQLKPAEGCLSTDGHIRDDNSWTENHMDTNMSAKNEQVEQASTASSLGTMSPLETEQLIQCSPKSGNLIDFSKSGTHGTDERKRKRLANPNSIFPHLKKLMKKNLDSHEVDVSKNKAVVGSDGKPLASDNSTVKLMLFGSLPHQQHALINHGNETTKPPKVVFARVDAKKKIGRGEPKSFCSATKGTLSQTKITFGTNMKLIAGKGEKLRSTNDTDIVGRQSRSVKRDKRSNESGPQEDLPIQDNSLNFSVLPTTFCFEDESTGREKNTEHRSD
ncbi:transcription termination factor 2, mitochondrial isoform X1 [Hippocampus zosterae]|uniref:transcription termination factor 2, mitochondrial isoform X1 n=1 Tax=Hippocampus zosterae TaxID=109293 RepID=UPI00223E8681|nr:transcription termination factor 2, mitochondrial isoform X1 [Hippocampus zosterae]